MYVESREVCPWVGIGLGLCRQLPNILRASILVGVYATAVLYVASWLCWDAENFFRAISVGQQRDVCFSVRHPVEV